MTCPAHALLVNNNADITASAHSPRHVTKGIASHYRQCHRRLSTIYHGRHRHRHCYRPQRPPVAASSGFATAVLLYRIIRERAIHKRVLKLSCKAVITVTFRNPYGTSANVCEQSELVGGREGRKIRRQRQRTKGKKRTPSFRARPLPPPDELIQSPCSLSLSHAFTAPDTPATPGGRRGSGSVLPTPR